MKEFLVNKYGTERGGMLYSIQQRGLKDLLANTTGRTKTQMKTLKNVILPKVALYQALQKEMPQEQAYQVVKEYMVTVVCAKSKEQYLMIEKLPGFPAVFQKLFVRTVLKSDNWKAECVQANKAGFQVDIHQCLWNDACVENGCPELTKVFCECDDINYGSLKKITFSRTGSIGKGSTLCDFHFKRNR